MRKGPSDKARACAVQRRRDKQTGRLTAIKDQLNSAIARVAAGDLDPALFRFSEIYQNVGISKATFYRYRDENEDVLKLCRALDAGASNDTETDPPDSNDAVDAGGASAFTVQLMEQVATLKTFIGMLQSERRTDKKTIRSHAASIKTLERKMAEFAKYAEKLRLKLLQHGVDPAESDEDSSKPAGLRIVKKETDQPEQ